MTLMSHVTVIRVTCSRRRERVSKANLATRRKSDSRTMQDCAGPPRKKPRFFVCDPVIEAQVALRVRSSVPGPSDAEKPTFDRAVFQAIIGVELTDQDYATLRDLSGHDLQKG